MEALLLKKKILISFNYVQVPSGQGNWIRQELELRAVVSRLMWLLKIEFESARISACS